MRQWDTKKEFKPEYKEIAKAVFTGIWIALRYPGLALHLQLAR